MTGQRHVMDSKGDSYEDLVQTLLGRIATLVKVPDKKDFGIDFFGQRRVASGSYTESIDELVFAVQVKGGKQVLKYGGYKNGWRQYELTWLKSLATPLYLAKVDADLNSVELFSLWPIWLIFWPHPEDPFEIRFVTEPAGLISPTWQQPIGTAVTEGEGNGDGKRWTVELGPPFLRLTLPELNDQEFQMRCKSVLHAWTTSDRLNMVRRQQFIPLLKAPTKWETNCRPIEFGEWQFWDPRPGVNISRLCQTAEPILVNLALHLEGQSDPGLDSLLPLLLWLQEHNHLGVAGLRLLQQISLKSK